MNDPAYLLNEQGETGEVEALTRSLPAEDAGQTERQRQQAKDLMP